MAKQTPQCTEHYIFVKHPEISQASNSQHTPSYFMTAAFQANDFTMSSRITELDMVCLQSQQGAEAWSAVVLNASQNSTSGIWENTSRKAIKKYIYIFQVPWLCIHLCNQIRSRKSMNVKLLTIARHYFIHSVDNSYCVRISNFSLSLSSGVRVLSVHIHG